MTKEEYDYEKENMHDALKDLIKDVNALLYNKEFYEREAGLSFGHTENIGTTFSNRINSFIGRFEKSGVNYFNNLGIIISAHLADLINESNDYLSDFLGELKYQRGKFGPIILRPFKWLTFRFKYFFGIPLYSKNTISYLESCIESYNALSDQIHNYSLEGDLAKTIRTYCYSHYQMIPKYLYFDSIRPELEGLGLTGVMEDLEAEIDENETFPPFDEAKELKKEMYTLEEIKEILDSMEDGPEKEDALEMISNNNYRDVVVRVEILESIKDDLTRQLEASKKGRKGRQKTL